MEDIVGAASTLKAHVLIVDSIQTMHSDRVEAAPGAVSQLRECTAELVRFAKSSGTAVLLVGHVTKEGQIAGPRVLEHMVDTVLYFESDTGSRYRVLRSVKNRFGAANEIGVFAMLEQGLREVANPSAIFLSRHAEPVPGSVITVMREGTRSLLIEVQVLADEALSANPRRVAVGIDGNRLTMLLAVAHRHGGLMLHGQDVFANVVGGVRLAETAGDLAIVTGRAFLPQQLARAGFADCLRRAGTRRRDSSGAVRRGTAARSRKTWLQDGAGSRSECAEATSRRDERARRGAIESGVGGLLARPWKRAKAARVPAAGSARS